MSQPRPTLDDEAQEPNGLGMCAACGNPLTEREMLLGYTCDTCLTVDEDDEEWMDDHGGRLL